MEDYEHFCAIKYYVEPYEIANIWLSSSMK